MHVTRSLHLIDLENLCGSGLPPTSLIEQVWRTYRYGVPTSLEDHYVVGSSHIFASRAWFVLPVQGVQRRARSGQDGGELAILADVDLDHAAKRFDRLVIASGDGMFTEAANQARRHGLHVHQVSGLGACSRALAASAHTHSRLRLGAIEADRTVTSSKVDQTLAA
ncbi:hypothetical protein ASD81_04375 [Nocardioides sp. Root614]|nr:hypothetical protein ASD81_04375 [Nocardioides sp. Root614]KRA91887.1 hypothetical protein ASD84_04640 [Nocardioides sp. Root682]